MSVLQTMGESGIGGTSSNWNMLGTTSKRDKQLWEERRKQYSEARARGEDPSAKTREEYERWYREERVPSWQERFLEWCSAKMRRGSKEAEGAKEEEKMENDKDVIVGTPSTETCKI